MAVVASLDSVTMITDCKNTLIKSAGTVSCAVKKNTYIETDKHVLFVFWCINMKMLNNPVYFQNLQIYFTK